jgi:hypothetical protein
MELIEAVHTAVDPEGSDGAARGKDGVGVGGAVAFEVIGGAGEGEGLVGGGDLGFNGLSLGVVGDDGLDAIGVGGGGLKDPLPFVGVESVVDDVGGVLEGVGDGGGLAKEVVGGSGGAKAVGDGGAVAIAVVGVGEAGEEGAVAVFCPLFDDAVEEVVGGDVGGVLCGVGVPADLAGASKGVVVGGGAGIAAGLFDKAAGLVVGVVSGNPLGVGRGDEEVAPVLVAGLGEGGAIGGDELLGEDASQGVAGVEGSGAVAGGVGEEVAIGFVGEGFIGVVGVEDVGDAAMGGRRCRWW